jgi:nucleotide-binding universal stress UspA family protein
VLYRRILCGIDFSNSSLAAFAYARALAASTHAHIDTVGVLQIMPLIDTSSAAALYYPGLTNEIQETLANRLESLAVEARADGVDVDAITAAGAPYEEILRLAVARKADLIVLGATGRGAVDRMLFGSTIDHVVRQASCPVLTVR